MNKEITKSVIVLTLIAVICTAILVVGNKFIKPLPPDIDPEVLKILQNITGSTNFADLDFSDISVDKDVLNVFKALDGDNKDALGYYLTQYRISGGSPVSGQYVKMIVVIKDGRVLGVDYRTTEGGMFNWPFIPEIFSQFEGKNIDNLPDFNALKSVSDAVSGATESTNSLILGVSKALADYNQNKEDLLKAPTKGGESLAELTLDGSPSYDIQNKKGTVRYNVVSKDAKKLSLKQENIANYDIEVTATDTEGNAVSAAITGKTTFSDEERVKLFVSLNDIEMGTYKITIKIQDKQQKELFKQTVEVMFADPIYIDIANWLNVSTGTISKVYDQEDDIDFAVFTAQGKDFDIAYGQKTIDSNDYGEGDFTTDLKVYVKIGQDGKIQGVKVINVDYGGYNNVNGDSLNGVDINGSGSLDLQDVTSGATVTRLAASDIVKEMIDMYKTYKAAD